MFFYKIKQLIWYAVIITFCLGNLGRISFFDQLINGYWYEIFLLGFLLMLMKEYGIVPMQKIGSKYKMIGLFFAYTAFIFAVTAPVFTFWENTASFLYYIRLLFYAMCAIYLIHEHSVNNAFANHLKKTFIFIGLLTIAGGIIQIIFIPNLWYLWDQGWDPHVNRMTGLWFEPMLQATTTGSLLIWLIQYWKWRKVTNTKASKNLFLYFLMISALGLQFFVTYSRGAYVAMTITILYLLVSHIQYRKYILLFLVGVIISLSMLTLLSPKGEGTNLLRMSTILARTSDFEQAKQIWQKSPLIGIGYNRIRLYKTSGTLLHVASHSGAAFHSSYLILLVTTGLSGVVLFGYIVLKWWSSNVYLRPILLFLGTFSLVDNVFMHPVSIWLLILYWVFSQSKFTLPSGT